LAIPYEDPQTKEVIFSGKIIKHLLPNISKLVTELENGIA